jgi:cytochrome c-type biogenesis protein CcmH
MTASNRAVTAISALAVVSVAASMTAGAMLTQPRAIRSAPPAPAAGPARPDIDTIMARVEALELRLEADPDDVDGWKMLGRSFMSLNRPREAVGAWSRAAQLAPSDPDVRAALAQLMDLARRSGAHEEGGAPQPEGELSRSR